MKLEKSLTENFVLFDEFYNRVVESFSQNVNCTIFCKLENFFHELISSVIRRIKVAR